MRIPCATHVSACATHVKVLLATRASATLCACMLCLRTGRYDSTPNIYTKALDVEEKLAACLESMENHGKKPLLGAWFGEPFEHLSGQQTLLAPSGMGACRVSKDHATCMDQIRQGWVKPYGISHQLHDFANPLLPFIRPILSAPFLLCGCFIV